MESRVIQGFLELDLGHGEVEYNSSSNINPRYSLRAGVREPGNEPLTTYLDNDTSGDDNPTRYPAESTHRFAASNRIQRRKKRWNTAVTRHAWRLRPVQSSPVHGASGTDSATESTRTISPNSSSDSSLESSTRVSDSEDSGYFSNEEDHPNSSAISTNRKQHSRFDILHSRQMKRGRHLLRPQYIMTRIAHPVKFNYRIPPYSSKIPCHWCQDMTFGLFGLGMKKRVEVIDLQDGSGYIEIDNGYTKDGHKPSRMCIKCTLDRLIIINCKLHDMKMIQGMSNVKISNDELIEYSYPHMAASTPFKWCSICPNPAYYECCRPQKEVQHEPEAQAAIAAQCPAALARDGCGLALCEKCVIMNASLGELVDSMHKDPGGEYGPRADADLLHPQGELVRWLESGVRVDDYYYSEGD